MTREDTLRLAREAQTAMLAQGRGVSVWNDGAYVGEVQEFCERFAAIVTAAEREACVKVCVEVGNRDSDNHAWDAAAAIRARDSHDRP
jgi:hypothetical protein